MKGWVEERPSYMCGAGRPCSVCCRAATVKGVRRVYFVLNCLYILYVSDKKCWQKYLGRILFLFRGLNQSWADEIR